MSPNSQWFQKYRPSKLKELFVNLSKDYVLCIIGKYFDQQFIRKAAWPSGLRRGFVEERDGVIVESSGFESSWGNSFFFVNIFFII